MRTFHEEELKQRDISEIMSEIMRTSTVMEPEVEVAALGRPVSGIICLLLGMRRSSSIRTNALPMNSSTEEAKSRGIL